MIEIVLNNAELYVAAQVGSMRRVASIQRKLNNKLHSTKSEWAMDIDGAAAEMAVAKYLNMYWVPTVNAGKEADVAGFQVRSTNHLNGNLLIRENDVKREQYILVISQPPTFKIIGWIWSDDAKSEKYWRPPDETGGGAWWVPQSDLMPMRTIYE
jgi:hypothetical protein